MAERPTIYLGTHEAPEGSLRALGGTGTVTKLINVSIREARQAQQILDGPPEKAANILVNQGSSWRAAIELLLMNDMLTAQQCDLILAALTVRAEGGEKDRVRTAIASGPGRTIFEKATSTRSRLLALLDD